MIESFTRWQFNLARPIRTAITLAGDYAEIFIRAMCVTIAHARAFYFPSRYDAAMLKYLRIAVTALSLFTVSLTNRAELYRINGEVIQKSFLSHVC